MPLSCNLGTLTSWKPLGLSRPVTGLLCLFYRVKEQRNILHTVNIWKAISIGNMWRRECLLQHVRERKSEWKCRSNGKQGRRRKQPPDDLNEARGCCKLKDEAIDLTVWGNGGAKELS